MTPEEFKREVLVIKEKFKEGNSALLPALHRAQEIYGYLTKDAVKTISEVLDLSEEFIWDTATFYQFLRKKPYGKYHFYICTGLTCLMKGAQALIDYFENELGLREKEPDESGISFERVGCIGQCDGAPAVILNDEPIRDVNPDKLREIIEKIRSGTQPSLSK